MLSIRRLNEVPFLFFILFLCLSGPQSNTGHSGRLAACLARPQMTLAHSSR